MAVLRIEDSRLIGHMVERNPYLLDIVGDPEACEYSFLKIGSINFIACNDNSICSH